MYRTVTQTDLPLAVEALRRPNCLSSPTNTSTSMTDPNTSTTNVSELLEVLVYMQKLILLIQNAPVKESARYGLSLMYIYLNYKIDFKFLALRLEIDIFVAFPTDIMFVFVCLIIAYVNPFTCWCLCCQSLPVNGSDINCCETVLWPIGGFFCHISCVEVYSFCFRWSESRYCSLSRKTAALRWFQNSHLVYTLCVICVLMRVKTPRHATRVALYCVKSVMSY